MTSASGPSTFSLYASRFLGGDNEQRPQIFHPASPPLSTQDPFHPSPAASTSYPHLRGSSRSPSPIPTPPYPGPGIETIPDVGDDLGVLFQDDEISTPNPYAVSSSSSGDEGDLEADLDQVAAVRRSVQRPISERARKGWLAHQSVFPPSSSSDVTDSDVDADEGSDDDEDGNTPAPPDLNEPLLGPEQLETARGPNTRVPTRLHVYHGRFAHWEREGLRKYKDAAFLALWLTSLLGVLVGLLFVWGSTEAPKESQKPRPSLVPLLPLLFILVIPALALPPIFLLLLRRTVRPVLLATAVAIPFSLFVCGWWAFGASFESFEAPDRWWGTTGLRLCALGLWILSAAFARLVWVRRRRLEKTAAVVELSTQFLLAHPPLLLLTPILLAVFAVISIPFLTMLIRLATIGYWRHPKENTWNFQIRPYAGWLIFLVTLVWIWTWGVIRGVGRVTVAAVVGEWYFHRSEVRPLEVTTSAVHRATGTSLGSICLGAGIVATVRMAGRSVAELRRVTSPRAKVLPSSLGFLTGINPVLAVLSGVLDQLNGYALVYIGITGEAFWPSARRAVGLAGKRRAGHLLDYTLIKLLLTLSSTALAMFTATAGYLYMSHSVGNPGYAPIAGLLCGGVPFLAIRAGAAVLGDAADALFICHQIDRELGGGHCPEAKQAFSVEPKPDSVV